MGRKKKKTKSHRNKIRFLIFGGILLFVIATIFLMGSFNKRNNEYKKKVPKIEIILSNATIDEVNENGKWILYDSNELIINNNGEEHYFSNVELKGRGNASWMMDKKSYRIKLNEKANLLGLGKRKKWGLISNWLDDSLLRNDLAQYIAGMLNERYPIRGEFVELKIDGKDLGLYYLVNLMSIGKRMVDLRDSMGILVELDNAYCESGGEWKKSEAFGDCLVVEEVVEESNSKKALELFVEEYSNFEKAVSEGDFGLASEIGDMESWAKYYLLSEFTSNPDAYVTSWYLYKDGESDKIHAGLGWDFDAAFGNRNWGEWPEGFYSPNETMIRMKYVFGEYDSFSLEGGDCGYKIDEGDIMVSPVMCYLIDMPEFRDLVGELYKEMLMNKREEVLSYVRDKAQHIREVALRDDVLWGGDFDAEVRYLTWWIEERFNYFDIIYGSREIKPEIRANKV